VKLKAKFTLEHALKAQRGGESKGKIHPRTGHEVTEGE